MPAPLAPAVDQAPCPPFCVDCQRGSDATDDAGVTFHHAEAVTVASLGGPVTLEANRFDREPGAVGVPTVWLSIRGAAVDLTGLQLRHLIAAATATLAQVDQAPAGGPR